MSLLTEVEQFKNAFENMQWDYDGGCARKNTSSYYTARVA